MIVLNRRDPCACVTSHAGEEGYRGALTLIAIPGAPRRGIVRQVLAADIAKRLEHPAARLVVEQTRHCAHSLFAIEHAGLCPHCTRRARGSSTKDRRGRCPAAGRSHRQSPDTQAPRSPVADVDVLIVQRVETEPVHAPDVAPSWAIASAAAGVGVAAETLVILVEA